MLREITVERDGMNQLLVCALAHNTTLVEHNNAVTVDHGRQSVCNHYEGAARCN